MHPELVAHPAYFEKEIVKLADNVYQAFGFAASNVYMIIGDDGLIIVDTSETTAAAENILAEFRKITDLADQDDYPDPFAPRSRFWRERICRRR